MDDPQLEWDALEYEHIEKTPDWFWGLGLIALAGVAAAIFFENLLFAAIILLSAFALALYGARVPKMERFTISHRGIGIGKTLYPYQSLESFWVNDHPEQHPILIIKSKKIFMPLMIIPITHVNPTDIRERLLDELHEEEHHSPLTDSLMRYFHF